jgi:hypothetical protein
VVHLGHEEPRLAGQPPDLAGKAIVPDVLIQPHSAAVQVVFKFAAWARTVRQGAATAPSS